MSLYSDVNKRNPLVKSRVTDLEAIHASIDNIINTPSRQRLFRPAGIDFDDLIFELDTDISFQIKNRIYQAFQQDPRVRLLYDQTEVYPEEEDDRHVYIVHLRFQVLGFGEQIFSRSGSIRG